MLSVQKPRAIDLAGWNEIMQAYFDFYQHAVTQEHLHHVFEQTQNPGSGLNSMVVKEEDKIIGVINYIVAPGTFDKLSCYVSDLYVYPQYRGNHLAEKLIAAVETNLALIGCNYMYWLTAPDNLPAQKLYNRIAHKASWMVYEKDVIAD